MAQIIGEYKVTGSIGGITFYQMDGLYYARQKSTATGKKRRGVNSFAARWDACRLASALYKTLPKEDKGREVFQRLTGTINLLMINGWREERVREWFEGEYLLK